MDMIAVNTTRLSELTQDIHKRLRRSGEDVYYIGKALIEAKALLPYGQFTRWFQDEFRMSVRTAQNFMRVARAFDGRSEIISRVPATMLYALAGEDDSVIDAVSTIASQGISIDASVAQALKVAPTPLRERFEQRALSKDQFVGLAQVIRSTPSRRVQRLAAEQLTAPEVVPMLQKLEETEPEAVEVLDATGHFQSGTQVIAVGDLTPRDLEHYQSEKRRVQAAASIQSRTLVEGKATVIGVTHGFVTLYLGDQAGQLGGGQQVRITVMR